MITLFANRKGFINYVVGALLWTLSCAPHAQDISVPEQLLFLSNHFIKTQTQQINYAYHQHSKDASSDIVSLQVLAKNSDGTASVQLQYLSGDNAVTIPALDRAQGNPVILGFLERDIADMKRQTGGSTAYFRKRIRLALAEPATPIEEINVTYNGASVRAKRITVHPYANDPMKERFSKFANKAYVFVLSDDVPGSLYSAYTILPGATASPEVDTNLTIKSDPSAS